MFFISFFTRLFLFHFICVAFLWSESVRTVLVWCCPWQWYRLDTLKTRFLLFS